MTTPETAWTPLQQDTLTSAAGPEWSVRLLATAGSTNVVAAEDPVPGTIVVADHQTAGRGRLDRSWETPPGSALTFSAVVDPGLADHDWPLLPLAVALGVADGVRRATGLSVRVKWPNDLLLEMPDGEKKVAGILLERIQPGAVPLAVIGIGINVGLAESDLPVPTATSLAIAGSDVDRTTLFGAVAHSLAAILVLLRADSVAVLERYRAECGTVGREVEVQLPGGEAFTGRATGIDRHGRLLVADRPIGAGDVIHVRPA